MTIRNPLIPACPICIVRRAAFVAKPGFGDAGVRGIITKERSIQIMYCGIIDPACDKCQSSFHTTADNNHTHGSFVGQDCPMQAQQITVEVILCKYSRQNPCRPSSFVTPKVRTPLVSFTPAWPDTSVSFFVVSQTAALASITSVIAIYAIAAV